MVKVGPQWMTVAERAQLKGKGAGVAEEARQLLKQGRTKDADALLQQALEVDPTNVGALYLRGLVYYKQDQVPQSRKSFEAVVAQLKDHAASFNNLAILLWRQNQHSPAMNLYTQAMLASPQNRRILNNVAEALNALPQNLKATAVAQKALKTFTDQDALLQAQMAKQGLYRWGSTWLDKAQIDRLTALEKEIQKKVDALAEEYDDVKRKLSRAEGDMDDNLRRMKGMEEASVAVDGQGRVFRTQLPRRYYDLAQENRGLAADREEYAAKLSELRDQAKKVQQQMPTPRFTSTQRMIEVEGMPGVAGGVSGDSELRGTGAAAIEAPAFVPEGAGKGAGPTTRAGVGIPASK
jgi:tetratricopeptide (TPR) repeat protein